MINEISKLVEISDKLDEIGLSKEADFVDQHIIGLTKTAKAGYHKCGLKEETVEQHNKLLAGYIKASDHLKKEYKKIIQSSNEIDSPNYGALRDIMQNYAHNINAINFHEMYFEDTMKNNPYSIEKDNQMKAILKELDCDYSKFEKEIKRLAEVSRNGWVLLSYCTITKKLHFNVIDLHDQHLVAMSIPILALDMWEHAYYSDFGLDKSAYVDWYLSRLDWRNPRKRIKNILRMK
jgi:superoxide dismutase, Fe-Mn family